MYDHNYKDLINSIRLYIDHVKLEAVKLQDEGVVINIADSNRNIHYYLNRFRNHAGRDDHHTALILLCIVRRCLYRYLADALRADVEFNLSTAAFVLRDLEAHAERLEIKEAVK